MPEYNHDDLEPWQSVIVHFSCPLDREAFFNMVNQRVVNGQGSIWFPEAEIGSYRHKRYASNRVSAPRYPIYIISKGRWESRQTSKQLDKLKVPYHIVVEPQEFEQYAAHIDAAKILTLPFSNLGQGSIPARNWVWDHAKQSGAERHWILDDNIAGFYRFQDNLKTPVSDAAIFCAAEDFTDRYDNIAQSGFNYFKFVTRKSATIPPFVLNTRIYSCILIKNDLPYRWRGRYNEDTDLSIRCLKDGWSTVLFNAFLADKTTTMTMKGGNTEDLYQDDGRLKMAESLVEQHPDIVTVTEKWGRPQHQVDYSSFKLNKLKLKNGVTLPEASNNYGMELRVEK